MCTFVPTFELRRYEKLNPCALDSALTRPLFTSRTSQPKAASGRLKFHIFLKACSSLSVGAMSVVTSGALGSRIEGGRRLTTVRAFWRRILWRSL